MTIVSRSVASSLVVLCLGSATSALAEGRGADVVLEDMKKLVVMVEGRVGNSKRQGAGIIAGADGEGLVVITADHVVREGDQPVGDVRVRFNWHPDRPVVAKLLSERIPPSTSSATSLQDLAVLRIESASQLGVDLDALPFDRLGEPESLSRGDDVYFMGNPLGHHWWVNVTPGKFADSTGDVLSFESKHLAEGYSGGPLLDSHRDVIGLVFLDDGLVGQALDITGVMKRLREWRLPVRLGVTTLPASFETLSPGYPYTCGVAKGGFGYCWMGAATDQSGVSGKDSEAEPGRPGRIAGGIRFNMVDAGEFYVCGVTASGQAYCFGTNSEGQLGNSDVGEWSEAPVAVAGKHVFRSISAGYSHACGLTEAGAALCWGEETGREPAVVKHGVAFDSITCGRKFTCGLTKGGRVSCWGRDWNGLYGAAHLTFRQVSAGSGHACGVTVEGTAYCWGRNDYGELGDDSKRGPVAGDLKFARVSAGDEFSCGITVDGRAYCWGNNTWGTLGDGRAPPPKIGEQGVVEEHYSRVPVQVSTDTRFRDVTAGKARYACGIARDETVYCWGRIDQRLRKTYGDYGPMPRRVPVIANAAR